MVLVCRIAKTDLEPFGFGLPDFRGVTDYVEFANQAENYLTRILHGAGYLSKRALECGDLSPLCSLH